MSQYLLEVKNLSAHFVQGQKEPHSTLPGEQGGKIAKAVDGVSFSIAPQETLGLVGESGCGKSVCSLSILRILPTPPAKIASGEIWFEGEDLLKLNEKRMRSIRGNKIAMVFQEPMTAFNPVYTVGFQVREALQAHRSISKKEADSICAELFAKVGIPSPAQRLRSYPHELSGGLRQRAMIAMALALQPALLIADEPTTALDVTVQAQILELLKELRREYRMAMLLISHDMGIIAEMADRVAVMYAGNIVETGSARDIFRNPLHPYTKALLESIPRLGQNKQRLISIGGVVPNAAARPSGCTFHPRCPIKEKRCETEIPEYRQVEPGRWVSCHFSPSPLAGEGRGGGLA